MEVAGPLGTPPAACSFPGENARCWEALGEARPGTKSGCARHTPRTCIHSPTFMFLYLNVEGEMWLKFASRANLKGAMELEGCKVAIWWLTGEGSGGSILPASIFLQYSMMNHGFFLTPIRSVSFSLTCKSLALIESLNVNDPGGSYINIYPKGKL